MAREAGQEPQGETPKGKGSRVRVDLGGLSNSVINVSGGSLGGNVDAEIHGDKDSVSVKIDGQELKPDENGEVRYKSKDGSEVNVSSGSLQLQERKAKKADSSPIDRQVAPESQKRQEKKISTLDTTDIFDEDDTPTWITDQEKIKTLLMVFGQLSQGEIKPSELRSSLKEYGFEPNSWTLSQLRKIYAKNVEKMGWKSWDTLTKPTADEMTRTMIDMAKFNNY